MLEFKKKNTNWKKLKNNFKKIKKREKKGRQKLGLRDCNLKINLLELEKVEGIIIVIYVFKA